MLNWFIRWKDPTNHADWFPTFLKIYVFQCVIKWIKRCRDYYKYAMKKLSTRWQTRTFFCNSVSVSGLSFFLVVNCSKCERAWGFIIFYVVYFFVFIKFYIYFKSYIYKNIRFIYINFIFSNIYKYFKFYYYIGLVLFSFFIVQPIYLF